MDISTRFKHEKEKEIFTCLEGISLGEAKHILQECEIKIMKAEKSITNNIRLGKSFSITTKEDELGELEDLKITAHECTEKTSEAKSQSHNALQWAVVALAISIIAAVLQVLLAWQFP